MSEPLSIPARGRDRRARSAAHQALLGDQPRSHAMSGNREARNRAAREAFIALALILAVLIVGANFVLVEVRLLGFEIATRLGWALIAMLLLGFGIGVLSTRR